MSRLVVDTHALLWWLADDAALSEPARASIADPANVPVVSVASLWEIAIKQSLGKLDAPADLPEIIVAEGFTLLPVGAQHAWRVRELPFHHRDPFDRLLIAQAMTERVPILTADASFAVYEVDVRW